MGEDTGGEATALMAIYMGQGRKAQGQSSHVVVKLSPILQDCMVLDSDLVL